MTDRRSHAIRQTLAIGGMLLAFLFIVGKCTGCHELTPAEQAQVAADGIKLSSCASEAHLCKMANKMTDAGVSECWDGYEACMQAHGFRDGGPRTIAIGFDNGHPFADAGTEGGK